VGSPRRAGTNHRPGTNGSSPQGLFGLSEDVVGPQPLPVRSWEVEVCQGVCLRLLPDVCRLGAALPQHVRGDVVQCAHGGCALGAEDRGHDPRDPPGKRARARCGADAVAHEVHGASLPGSPLEDLLDGPLQPLVGIGDDEDGPRDAAGPEPLQEGEPGIIGLGVHDRDSQHMPPAAGVAAYRRDDGRGGDVSVPAALHVGRIEPDVGHLRVPEGPSEQLLHIRIEGLGYGAHLVLREPVHAQLLRDPLHLPGARPRGIHLGHRRHEGAVCALVALDHVLGEEASAPELGDPERQGPDAGQQLPLPVAIPAVAGRCAELVRLRAHDLVHDALCQLPEQLLHVDGSVGEPRHRAGGSRGRRHLCYAFHWAIVLSTNPLFRDFRF